MESNFPIDIAHSKYVGEIEKFNQQIDSQNESTTRLRIIDTILFDILQWDKDDVETEKYCRASGYADYVFFLSDKPILVIEAKKSGSNFLLPDRIYKDRPYQFGLLAKECKDAALALEQACGYAATLGSIYIAITNGHQWLFTLAFVPNQSLESRLVYVFESFKAIADRFSRFCKCFNCDGLSSNSISRELLDSLRLPAPAKLSSKIPGYPQVSGRNVFQNELSYILDFLWQVLAQKENSEVFVENCYVNPQAHSDILIVTKELIEKRKREDEIISEYNIETIDRLPQKIANLPAEKPFILLGEVGRGKSSFLKYLRYIAAKDNLKNYIQIELNFIDRPDSHDEIYHFVYDEVERQLLENYSIDIHDDSFVRGVLNLDLLRLKNTTRAKFLANDKQKYAEFEIEHIESMTEDKHIYLTKVFHHLKKGQKKSLALFFDNLDRRSQGIQEEAFLKASAIARDWASLVFICLRPVTYYKSRETGVLDTISPTAFTVGNPDLPLVLKRRFAYARKLSLGSDQDFSKSLNVPDRNVRLDLSSVAQLFESCEFAAWKKHGIVPTLEAISNGNIRRLLDFTRKILCSGHLDTKKILNKIQSSGNYYIPDYEGVKTLLFGNYMQYDPTNSPFVNLFDIQYEDASEHFTKLAILHYLAKTPNISQSNTYSKTIDLMSYLASLGFSYGVSMDSIQLLINKRYIHSIGQENLSDDDTVKISSLGRFHIFNLVTVFQYLDAVIVDTPILDARLRDQITEVFKIQDRLDRTELFLSYLNSCVKSIVDVEMNTLWETIYQKATENIDEIKNRLER